MRTVKRDLQEAVGSIQLCAGQHAGCKASIHAMESIFGDHNTVILVDATNAFNQLNRMVNCEAAMSCYVSYPNQHLPEQDGLLCLIS